MVRTGQEQSAARAVAGRQWDQRIRRAIELKQLYPYACEILTFYERIAPAQKAIYTLLEAQRGTAKISSHTSDWSRELDSFLLLPQFRLFLDTIAKCAPAPLFARASELRQMDAAATERMIADFWRASLLSQNGCEPQQGFILSMFVQPLAEYLADHASEPIPDLTPSLCPRCQSKPVVGVLRPEGDGGKRSLICSLCATEWNYRRILCPGCGEEDVNKMAVFSAAGIDHVRVEACDTCRTYIKTVDLTKDGRAIPLIDELATIPLNLWASEHGYKKSRGNLLGL